MVVAVDRSSRKSSKEQVGVRCAAVGSWAVCRSCMQVWGRKHAAGVSTVQVESPGCAC